MLPTFLTVEVLIISVLVEIILFWFRFVLLISDVFINAPDTKATKPIVVICKISVS